MTAPTPTGRGAATAALALLASLLAGACGSEESGRVDVAGPELVRLGADQVLVGLTHNMTREGVLQGELRADTAYVYNDDSTVRLRIVDVTFYDDRGRPNGRLTADSGRYDLQTGDMRAYGQVVVRDTAQSERLETEQLLYDALTGQLRTDTSFVWHRGQDVIRGTGLVTDPSLDNVQIQEPAGSSPSPGGP